MKRTDTVHNFLSRIMLLAVTAAAITLSSPLTVFAVSETTEKPLLNISVIYMVTTAISFIFLIGYCAIVKNRKAYFVLLFTSVFVVNAGYVFLALSKTLPEALLANRISYLGSVFLPLFMLLIIMDECRIKCHRILCCCLIIASVVVFFIAATPGYNTLYYRDVTLIFVDGGAKLIKSYGPLHRIYYIYLATYFLLMIAVIAISWAKHSHRFSKLAVNLLVLVLGNILVWFIEQVFRINFEFLSITYIITEMYLLSLYNIADDIYVQVDDDAVHRQDTLQNVHTEGCREYIIDADDIPDINDIIRAWPAVSQLTAREVEVFNELILNRKRKEIADQLCVSENTIKKHTSNIFTKLNVSSRNEILKMIFSINHN